MGKRVFISYSHKDELWVRDTLYPILSAGGAQLAVDYEIFEAGVAIRRQMARVQAEADVHVLVLTPDYFRSDYCHEEMERALAADPEFRKGRVIPVILVRCDMPNAFMKYSPLNVTFADGRESEAEPWRLLLQGCEANLGTTAPDWLSAFRRTKYALEHAKSVNLLVKAQPKWRELISELRRRIPTLSILDMDAAKTATLSGLCTELLRVLAGFNGSLTNSTCLRELERVVESRASTVLMLTHFERAADRGYGIDFYSSLRYLIMERRQLVLAVQSRVPFADLLPKSLLLSFLDMQTIDLGTVQ